MDRRTLIQSCGGLPVLLAGCVESVPDNTGESTLELVIYPEISSSDDGWTLVAKVRNVHDWQGSFHDVTLLAFSDTGDEVCRKQIGDMLETDESSRQEVTVTCETFPAILTATAAESPCEGAEIEILYWSGTDEQRRADLDNDVTAWESTDRNCDEPIPPERVLEA